MKMMGVDWIGILGKVLKMDWGKKSEVGSFIEMLEIEILRSKF